MTRLPNCHPDGEMGRLVGHACVCSNRGMSRETGREAMLFGGGSGGLEGGFKGEGREDLELWVF